MFSRCMFCHRDLPANETLEQFPLGRRVAYDPGRGRLWAVCPACRRWNLAPIEERWEALEELEKAVKDRSRLLSQTDNIALLRAGELEIVRVGRANLTEEAWWRYGLEMVKRRRTYQILTAAGVGGVLALMAGGAAAGAGVFGGWWIIGRAGRQLPKLSRALKFGRTAWRGHAVCPRCGSELTSIPFRTRGALIARPEGEESVSLQFRCERCDGGMGWLGGAGPRRYERWSNPTDRMGRRQGRRSQARALQAPLPQEGSGFLITGVEAEHLFRRVLAYQNFAGAKESQVRDATSLIESAGSAPSLTQRFTGTGRRLASVDGTMAIALEIAANEDRERRLLELELTALEERWKEEEEIAAIIDGELTWVPGMHGSGGVIETGGADGPGGVIGPDGASGTGPGLIQAP